jgi:hypothetical protein
MSTKLARDQNREAQPLSPDVRQHIGAHLQAAFADVEKSPLPDDHIELLLALRRNERELQRSKA